MLSSDSFFLWVLKYFVRLFLKSIKVFLSPKELIWSFILDLGNSSFKILFDREINSTSARKSLVPSI